MLDSQDFSRIREYAEGYELIAIDETQKVRNIGQGLKILVDHMLELRIIATGIRNAVICNCNPLELCDDAGRL